MGKPQTPPNQNQKTSGTDLDRQDDRARKNASDQPGSERTGGQNRNRAGERPHEQRGSTGGSGGRGVPGEATGSADVEPLDEEDAAKARDRGDDGGDADRANTQGGGNRQQQGGRKN